MIYFPKSQPAPACLALEKAKKSGKYNCNDVLERLKNDFKNKCYICEIKEPTNINIEHFKPHKENIDLKFDWNNLFFCCGHCNNTKLAKPIFDDILDCTKEADIDKKIKFIIKPFPREKAGITAIENTSQVNNTVFLLDQVYNGTTTLKQIESSNLRSKLLLEIRKFQDLLFDYDSDIHNTKEKEDIKDKIIRQLRNTSNFTAFKKWIIRDSSFYSEFSDYV